MTVAVSLERTRDYPLGVRRGALWNRLIIVAGLVSADLICFFFADMILRSVAMPPALALFRNRLLGQPNTVIDLVMLLAGVFILARYLVGDYSRRQLFWDGARVPPRPRFCFAVSVMAPRFRFLNPAA